jgi:tRNA-uridine 2-sulfurtransferase
VLNLEEAFGRDVVGDFVNEYARGRTPIPCVRCNTFTKFRDLVSKADYIEAEFVATGHYARVLDGQLLRGTDPAKDQSYFLWGLRREVLSRLLLPVGWQTKPETRAVAHRLGLEVVAEKTESQDICFVPDGDHAAVIASRLGPDSAPLARGPVMLANGRVVGEHNGYARFTVGQRKGLPSGFAEPLYVIAIRPESRAVIVGPREELLGRGVVAREVNWLGPERGVGARVSVRIRHRAPLVDAELIRADGDEIELALQEPVAAIAPGQSLVMYDGERVLGGGVIERSSGTRSSLPVLAA